ncbi:MAG: hydrolase [Burkholderia gladioli]
MSSPFPPSPPPQSPSPSVVPATPAELLRYVAPRWLPTNHAQTIFPALFGRRPEVRYRRERWDTPDDDFIDLDWIAPPPGLAPAPDAPLMVVFHGLEGSSDSRYARLLMAAAQAQGWHGVVPHFRSCSGEMNRQPRFYHLADADELDWILRRLAAGHRGPVFAVGVSLGGNVLLHWLGQRRGGRDLVAAAAAVSTPLDVHAGGRAISTGFSMVYTRAFLKTLKVKALAKLDQHPGLFDRQAALAARNMHEYDDVVTAPLHGFSSADDYWTRATVRPLLRAIEIPTLILNARNDPFLPATALPGPGDVSAAVELDQPEHGGHVGFTSGRFPGQDGWLPQRVFGFVSRFLDHG